MKLDFDAPGKGRMALYRTFTRPEDLAGVEDVAMDVYYGGSGAANISLILTAAAGGRWLDFETPPLALRNGWNSLIFAVKDGFFRQLGAGGRDFDAELTGADRIGRVGFMLYRKGEGPGMILLRDVRVHEN